MKKEQKPAIRWFPQYCRCRPGYTGCGCRFHRSWRSYCPACHNLIEQTDQDGYVTSYAYSPIDLVTNINYNGVKEVHYAYNKVGQLVKMDDWLGTTTYEVDLLLAEQIAIGIIAVGVLDGLQIFLARVDIPDFYHTAHAVIFVFCNPAVGIALFCYTVHPVIVIAGHIAVVALGYGFQVLYQVIGVAHHGIVGIGDGAFVAHRIIGICYGISSVV